MKRVYGPYRRKDGRQHVIHYDDVTKKKRTQSYPRYLMELHLGRPLETWEQVDHINNDPTNDRIENFQLLTQAQNNKKSAKGAELFWFICPVCQKDSYVLMSQYNNNQVKQGRDGPYCSRSCAGTAHH